MGSQAVLVDSNAIVGGDWTISDEWWSALLERSRMGLIRVVVPELVIGEVVARYGDKLQTVVNGARYFARLGVELQLPDVSAETIAYEDALRSRLGTHLCVVPELPVVDLEALANRAIYRIAPFNASGNGFRDALIWQQLLAEAESLSEISLISADNRAFGDGALPWRLSDEAESATGVSVSRFDTVKDFLASVMTDDEHSAHFELLSLVDREGADGLFGSFLDGADVDVDSADGSGYITHVNGVEIDKVWITSNPAGGYQVEFQLEVDADVQLDVWWEDYNFGSQLAVTETLGTIVEGHFDPESGELSDFIVNGFGLEWTYGLV